MPSASPSFSSTSQGRPRAAGVPQRLFVSLFTSRRAPESLFTDCSNLPLFPLCSLSLHLLLPPQSSPSHSHGPRSRSLPCSPPCHQSQGWGGGEGAENFLRLTRCVFRRPIPTQMMNTTSFQISHPLSAAAAACFSQMITSKHGSTGAIISYTEPHIPSDAEPLYLDCSKTKKKKKTQR